MSGVEVRLLAIVGPPVVPLDRVVEQARAAEAGGVTAVQLRAKHAPAGTLLALTRGLIAALSVPVYVNDRADVAVAAGARGVHLGADDIAPSDVRRWAPGELQIGVSAGTPGEAARARLAKVDYWSVGAVYATETKPDAGTPIGVDGFRALAAQAPPGVPVIAIGGIRLDNAAELLAAGAAGIALSSAIFAAPDVTLAARAFRRLIG